MTRYMMEKEKARNKAIAWQADFENHHYSWGELCEMQAYFEKLARRYGLITEFRESLIL